MDLVLGKTSSLATNKPLPPSNGRDMASVGSVTMDNRRQRLFVGDGIRVSRHEQRNRLLVFDVHPDRLRDYSEAVAVIGQPDLETNTVGVGPAKFGGGSRSAIDEEDDWLFAVDGANNRVLVFDVHPERLRSGPEAIAVLGQPDLNSNTAGIGRGGLSRPAFVAYDSAYRRLFVTDAGNQRILVYDVSRSGLRNGQEATIVLGQVDFNSRESRTDPKKAAPSDIAVEPETQRLMVSEIGNNRILIFDIHPDRLKNNPDAINVIGQPDFDYTGFDPTVSRNTTRSPHQVAVDSKNQLIYMVDGFSGRNGVTIFDIHPDRLKDQPDAMDVLGKLNDAGEPDFESRAANDVINGRFSAEIRSLALDAVDHRLIAGDQYNHRVLIWQLDEDNRIQDRTARWVIGQPDLDSSFLRERSAKNLKKPYALAYDDRYKRLFIAETLSDRVTVWDLDPERISNYPEAIAVIGQRDFTTRLPQRTGNGLFLGDSMGHGIGSGGPRPTGLAIDVEHQRLFVSDGANHRVMVYDVDPSRLHNHPEAIGVLGQPDFTSGRGPAPGARSVDSTALTALVQSSRGGAGEQSTAQVDQLFWPAALDYDARHGRLFVADGSNNRVMVFEADPMAFRSGTTAIAVIGQPDFTSNGPGAGQSGFQWPDGVAYDSVRDQLYVTDMGNDRVLVFDVAPDRLRNGPDAVAVLGQMDFDTWWAGPEQEQLSDPRDIEFDSRHQRLFVADSYQTRIVSFDMPAPGRDFQVPPYGVKRYSTLDWKQSTTRSEGYMSVLQGEGKGVIASLMLTSSEQVMDKASERESRILRGELSLLPSAFSRTTWIYAAANEDTRIVINNSAQEPAELEITLSDLSGHAGERPVRRNIESGEQLIITVEELWEGAAQGSHVVEIKSDKPVGIQGLVMRGPVVISESPTIRGDQAARYLNIPRIEVGGGYQSEVILVNPLDQVMRGELSVYGLKGGELTERYEIAPGGAYVWSSEPSFGLSRTAYIMVRGEGTIAPLGGAWVTLLDDDELVNRTYVPGREASKRAWIPVDTYPTTTRHGRINVKFNFVNQGADPPAAANIRINLFSPDGKFAERYEQNLPINAQWETSLVELSRRDRFRGNVRIVSDVPILISATQVTENVEGGLIEAELSVIDPENTVLGNPLLLDGDGVASEVILLNPTDEMINGEFQFFSAQGQREEIILR